MTEITNPSELRDYVTVYHNHAAAGQSGKAATYAFLTFNDTRSEESITVPALKLLTQDLNRILAAVAQPGLIKGAIFPGENHALNPNTPEDWVSLDCHVASVGADGQVTEAYVNFEFNYTETLESISLAAARQLGAELNRLMAKIEYEAQANQAVSAER